MSKVKIAVVGCGERSGAHIANLAAFSDVELVGFYDFRPERAEAKMSETGSGKCGFETVGDMLDAVNPDALLVCVPPDQHGDIELEAINRGIGILVEPPMALDAELAEKIRSAADEKGVIAAAAFQDRYLDVIGKAREFLDGRRVAIVSGGLVDAIHGPYWWPFEAASGGQIVEQNIHNLDLCRYLIGDAVKVYCAAGNGIISREDYDIPDYSSSVITFKNNAVANIFTGCYKGSDTPEFKNGLQIFCGDCEIDYRMRESVTFTENGKSEECKETEDSLKALDRAFIDAIKANDASSIRSTYGDACETLKLALACNRSVATGMAIDL